MQGEIVDNRNAEHAQRNEDDQRACLCRRSMLRLSPSQPRQSEKREYWNLLTSGSGWRRRWIGPTTPPTLKPTRSHSEGRWTSEANDTSATSDTGGYSTTRPMTKDGDSYCHVRLVCVLEARDELSSMD